MQRVITQLLCVLVCLLASCAQAAISYVAYDTEQGNDDFGTLTLPVSVQANDVVLVQVTIRNRTSSDDSITAPTGWTLIGSQIRDNDVLQSMYYRVASATDASASYTWDFEGTGDRRFILGGTVFRGVDTTTPVHVVSSNSMTSSDNITASSVTPTLADTMLAAFYSVDAGNRTMDPATGMTEAYDTEESNTANGLSVMGSYEPWAATGATGGRTAVISVSSDDGIAHLIALTPGAMPPTISGITGDCTNIRRVVITFSEDVSASTATNTANYTVTNPSGVAQSVLSAVRSPNNIVTLTLAADLNDLTAYSVSISNVQDLDGNTIIAASSASFSLSCELNCFTDTFAGPGSLSDDWSVDNSSGSFGNPRIITDQRMRLTDASGNVATVANLLLQFPAANNRIDVEFDYYAYNGSGADGVAVTFSDATITPVPGGYGGSLGYAQRSGINGFAGGWLGVGIDEYGNFSNPTEGRASYAGSGAATNQGFYVDSVAVRGSGSGTTGYPFLRGTGTLSPGVDQGGATAAPGHRYRITLDHTAGGGAAYVTVARDTGSGYATIISSFNVYSANPSQAAVPENWVVSFTGSTGGSTNIHEIADLKICAAVPFDTYSLVDHYHLSHSGNGITCEAEPVTITAHDAGHNPVNVTSDTSLTVTTDPAVTAVVSSPVTITSGSSSTTVDIQQTSAHAGIDIDVLDGSGRTEQDGVADHDPALAFADTGLRFYANGVISSIGHQIMNKPSSSAPNAQTLTLRALRTNDATMACEAAVTGSHDVSIAYECQNPLTCSASRTLNFLGESISGTNSGFPLVYDPDTVSMNFNASGEATFSFDFNDVGKIELFASLTVPASAPDPEFTLTGYSGDIYVRPFGFEVETASTNALDATAPFFTSAGTDFDVNLRAVGWESADDGDDNNGVPDDGADLTDNVTALNFGNEDEDDAQDVTLTSTLVAPASGDDGVLTAAPVASTALVNGLGQMTASWSEVGIINLEANLSDYLGVSDLDIAGNVQNVGRFIPARFSVTAANGDFANSCGTFTYIGQPFTYGTTVPSLTITAQNAGGVTTQNYTSGAFQKLVAADVVRTFPIADGDHTVLTTDDALGSDGATALAVSTSNTSGTFTSASLGVITYSFASGDSFTYTKNANAKVAPFTGNLGIVVTEVEDSDGVAAATLPTVIPDSAATGQRYGRLRMENAYGPETFDLRIPMSAEFYNGTAFELNRLDNCTGYDSSDLILTFDPSVLSTSSTGAGSLETGVAPTESLADGADKRIELSAPGADNVGTVALCLNVDDWMKFDWGNTGVLDLALACGAAGDANPKASATFGQYRGHDRIIYWREVDN